MCCGGQRLERIVGSNRFLWAQIDGKRMMRVQLLKLPDAKALPLRFRKRGGTYTDFRVKFGIKCRFALATGIRIKDAFLPLKNSISALLKG